MCTMAGLTAGSQTVTVCGCSPVKTLHVLRLLVRMTGTAIYWRQFLSMREFLALQVAVAIGAFQGGMRGSSQRSGINRRRQACLTFARASPAIVAAGADLRSR